MNSTYRVVAEFAQSWGLGYFVALFLIRTYNYGNKDFNNVAARKCRDRLQCLPSHA